MVLAIVFQTFASAENPEKLRHAMRQMSREEFHLQLQLQLHSPRPNPIILMG